LVARVSHVVRRMENSAAAASASDGSLRAVAELQVPFDEFRIVLVRQIKELTADRPAAQSTAWYLLKYLRRIHAKVVVSTSPREVDSTIRGLLRFYLDAVDKGSDLETRCKEVLRYHRRSLRLQRRN